MYVATIVNAPDDYRLLAFNKELLGAMRDAYAMVNETPDLLRRLERGGIMVIEFTPTCGTLDQLQLVAGRHAQEAYDRTRATWQPQSCPGGSGDQSPAGPPADRTHGD